MINDWLGTLEERVKGILRRYRMEGKPLDLKLVKEELKGIQQPPEEAAHVDFFDFWDQYQLDLRHSQSAATQKVTATLISVLKRFQAWSRMELGFPLFYFSRRLPKNP